MGKNELLIRIAIEKDSYQAANVILDFYNTENMEEATKVFINRQEKKSLYSCYWKYEIIFIMPTFFYYTYL